MFALPFAPSSLSLQQVAALTSRLQETEGALRSSSGRASKLEREVEGMQARALLP